MVQPWDSLTLLWLTLSPQSPTFSTGVTGKHLTWSLQC